MARARRWTSRQKWVAAAGAVVLLLALTSGGGVRASSSARGGDPRGPRRDGARAPARPRCQFARDMVRELGALGVTGRPAVLLAAHFQLETGGRPRAHNVGNIVADPASLEPWYRFDVVNWRAFDSDRAGALAVVDLLRNGGEHYRAAWRLLNAGDAVGWYDELGRGGYYGDGSEADIAAHVAAYRDVLAYVERCVPS